MPTLKFKRKTSALLFSKKGLKYLRYLPKIITTIKNWPIFLLNYIGLRNESTTYYFRNGKIIKTNEGIDATTIAVIFVKEDYRYIKTGIKFNYSSPIIIDVGANLGLFSLYINQIFPKAKIYAYEPAPANFSLLKNNIKINGLSNNIFPFQLALSTQEGKRRLYLKTSPQHSFFRNKEGNYIEVECTTLQKIFADNQIKKCDILKLDCEGAEYEILYNLPKKDLDKITNHIIECHNTSFLKENYNCTSLRKWLERQGFFVKSYNNILCAHRMK